MDLRHTHQLDGVVDSVRGACVQCTRPRVLLEMCVGGGHVVASEKGIERESFYYCTMIDIVLGLL